MPKTNPIPTPEAPGLQRPRVPKLAYTVVDAAEASGISRSSLYECIRSGELKSVLRMGRRLIMADALISFLEGTAPQAA